VAAECAVGLLGTIGRRRQSVGAEADPGQERDQRDAVENLRVADVPRLADEPAPQPALLGRRGFAQRSGRRVAGPIAAGRTVVPRYVLEAGAGRLPASLL
jgi:hypothetical protein